MLVLLFAKPYLILLIPLLLFISVLIIFIQVRTKKYSTDLSLDVYTLLDPYKIISVNRSLLLLSLYFLITLFPFLYLRSYYLGKKVFIGEFTFYKVSLTSILISIVVIVVISIYLITINTLFYRELQKLHFFLVGFNRYARFLFVLRLYPYDSLIICNLTTPITDIVGAVTTVEDMDNYIERKQRLGIISSIEIRLLKFFYSLFQTNVFFRYLLLFVSRIVFGIDYHIPRWLAVLPEMLLFFSLLVDINFHELYYFYYFSFIYIFLIIIRKMKNFWLETDLDCDDYIHNYLYKGEKFGIPLIEESDFGNSQAYFEIKKYIKNGFKYWMMIDDPSRGPWHMLLKKDNFTQKYIYLLMIFFLGVMFDGSSYIIYCSFLDIEVPWIVLLLPILFCKYLYEKKVFSFAYEIQKASYNKVVYRFLWLLLILQYSFYLYIYFKNSFFDLCEEVLIDKFGFLITENFTYSYKRQYFLDYLHYSTVNILDPILNTSNLWPNFNDSIETIRICVKELIQNHLYSTIQIDEIRPIFGQFTELSYNTIRNKLIKMVIIQEILKSYNQEIYNLIINIIDMYNKQHEMDKVKWIYIYKLISNLVK